MNERTSARWQITVSLLCYLVGAPLVAYFVSPNGLGGLLFAYPLYTVTWLLGRRRGLAAAGMGAGLNAAIWFFAGSGRQVLFRSGPAHVAFLFLVECVGYAVFVLIVSNMKLREDQSREETRRSKDLLYLSEMQYRNLVEGAPLPIFFVRDDNLIFFNNLAHEMLGYSHEELMGMPMKSILHEEDYENAWRLYAARSEGKLLPKSTTRIVTKHGKVLWVETIGQQIEWEGKNRLSCSSPLTSPSASGQRTHYGRAKKGTARPNANTETSLKELRRQSAWWKRGE